MAHDLQSTTLDFLTYNSKADPSDLDQRFLVPPSKNVIISDQRNFATRQGFSLQSPAGTGGAIKSSTEWENSTGDDFPLRAYFSNPDDLTSGILEFLISGAWETLMSALTSVDLIFDPYWDDTEKIDRLLWCDGTPNLKDWSGATARLSSITATTITCSGSKTFGQQRFLTTGTRAIRIKDDSGTWHRVEYTGGEGSTQLTGLTVDLTGFSFTNNNLIVQEVVTRSNIPDSAFSVDFLKVIDNQVWAGSRVSNKIYVSKNTSITDYTFSTPRAIGEGALLTLDGPGRAVGNLRGDVILFAGKNFIYKSVFNQITVGATLAETLKVQRLKTTSLQSALHQNLVANVGNGLVWVGYDNVLHKLVDATLAYNPDLRDESDPLKPDFDATDFTGGHTLFYKNRLHISAPASSINFIEEYRLNDKLEKIWFWQPPQTYAVSRYAVINDAIHGHSSATSETYKLFDGYNDNNQAIHAIALLARWNGGVRQILKQADEFFTEGAISANTTLPVTYFFDLDGGETLMITKQIKGTYADILYPNARDVSLGTMPLGDESLSGDITTEDSTFPYFRVIDDLNETEFFDFGVLFETNDIDYRWEVRTIGNNAVLASGLPTAIKNDN